MDHWGDPWADAAANGDSPTKQEVATPPPQHATFTPAPVLLNGFLDDAQWGSNEDEGFGVWAASPGKPDTATQARVNGTDVRTGWEDHDEGRKSSLDICQEDGRPLESNEWSRIEEDVEVKEGDNVVSETSDSGTTIQPDDAPTRPTTDSAESLHPDEESSTRPSTSPSDTSHNEAATESPRTSFEEERAAGKVPIAEDEPVVQDETDIVKANEEPASAPGQADSADADDEFGDFEEDVPQDTAEFRPNEYSSEFPVDTLASKADRTISSTADEETRHAPISRVHTDGLDEDLLSQLFPPAKPRQKLEDTPQDPVHSTSTRKAWYRLSRKQTMREYNNGNVDDNYIRVTWKTSHIRSEVIKTVSRWANEDRMAGRGPGARASFYWDTPAPPHQQYTSHSRKKTSISVSNPAPAARHTVQPISTDVPAAFDWSSPAAGHDPWKDTSIETRAVSSPVAPSKHSAVAKLQRQEGRPMSVDLTPRTNEPTSHKRTSTNVDLLAETPPRPSFSPLEPPKPPPTNLPADPWAGLGALDTSTKPPVGQEASVPDDDEWGEMVESPAVSSAQTPTAIADMTSFSKPPTRNTTLSTPSTTPKSIRSSPLQPLAPASGSKHASPIVRLKGTVSPTSALFKVNAFVPASAEDGPIGPGLLKARNRSVESTPEKSPMPPRQVAQMDRLRATSKTSSPPLKLIFRPLVPSLQYKQTNHRCPLPLHPPPNNPTNPKHPPGPTQPTSPSSNPLSRPHLPPLHLNPPTPGPCSKPTSPTPPPTRNPGPRPPKQPTPAPLPARKSHRLSNLSLARPTPHKGAKRTRMI
ncbi:hypothetical protein K458DRAFT_337229 [Lentithecium fluviatile CBS 122367]|uniref:Uncharacterized protein n=1 Tax=Lentithecium fluviatile CBS 122367 TaxID=1168545 RepID=A0A6G1J4T6_9PLEO|nr:hypothetical protein K458DRAFT_337229 [Lentithecium fluviatile CBS 122367]